MSRAPRSPALPRPGTGVFVSVLHRCQVTSSPPVKQPACAQVPGVPVGSCSLHRRGPFGVNVTQHKDLHSQCSLPGDVGAKEDLPAASLSGVCVGLAVVEGNAAAGG